MTHPTPTPTRARTILKPSKEKVDLPAVSKENASQKNNGVTSRGPQQNLKRAIGHMGNSPVIVQSSRQNKFATNWADTAIHNGGILLFAMKAGIGKSIVQLYSQRELHPTVSEQWYKHAEFDTWERGVYRQVILELWSKGHPVVRLVFNSQHSDKYSWFYNSILEEAYPWNKQDVLSNTEFVRTR